MLPNFDQLVAVAAAKGAPVMLDGMAIDETRFVPAGGDRMALLEVARMPLAICPPRELVCTHRLTGSSG